MLKTKIYTLTSYITYTKNQGKISPIIYSTNLQAPM